MCLKILFLAIKHYDAVQTDKGGYGTLCWLAFTNRVKHIIRVVLYFLSYVGSNIFRPCLHIFLSWRMCKHGFS
jgi:hypothetical protein